MSKTESPISEGNEIAQLRAARDAALLTARESIRDTTRLTRLLTILGDPTSLEQLLDRVVSTLSELFSADIVVLLDPAGNGSFSPLAAIGLPEDVMREPFSHAEESYTLSTMKFQLPILLDEMETDPNVDLQLRDLGARTGVWLPVIGNYEVRGVLIMVRCNPIPFVRHDVGLLAAMIHRVGLSLEQAQKSSQLRQVVHFGREIARQLDESDVFSKAAAMFPSVTGADAVALFMKGSSGRMECVAETRFNRDWMRHWSMLTNSLISSIDLNNVRPYDATDLQRAFDKLGIEPAWNASLNSVVAVPILCAEQVHGILYGVRFSAITFNPDTLQVAMLYAGQTSAAIEAARLYRSVHNELNERKQAEQALRASDDRFRALIRSVSDVISILTAEGRISYISPAAEIAWGCSARNLLFQSVFDRIHLEDRALIHDLLSELLQQPNATLTQTVRLLQGGDNWRVFDVIFTNLLHEPAVSGIVATYHDVTERKLHEQELREMAFRDPLTGLPNRSRFRDLLTEALLRTEAGKHSVAVIFLDLDNFKTINDRMGHAWGDHLLRIVADRLQACLRKSDLAARLGGDEFTIIVDEVTDVEQVMQIAYRLINALRAPIRLKDCDLFVGGSFGIVLSSSSRDTVDELLHKADVAMYAAKSQEKGSYAVFDAELNAPVVGRIEDAADL
jgi:diguanylate cyclase (GGDEF)-like protein/PAS domain S-box-containing protein